MRRSLLVVAGLLILTIACGDSPPESADDAYDAGFSLGKAHDCAMSEGSGNPRERTRQKQEQQDEYESRLSQVDGRWKQDYRDGYRDGHFYSGCGGFF